MCSCCEDQKHYYDYDSHRSYCDTCEPNTYQEATLHIASTCIACGPVTPVTPFAGMSLRDRFSSYYQCLKCAKIIGDRSSTLFLMNPKDQVKYCSPYCNKGEYLDEFSISRDCVTCPVNTYQDEENHRFSLCKPCPANSISEAGSLSVLECKCPENSWMEYLALQSFANTYNCKPCPINSISALGSDSLFDCQCTELFKTAYDSNSNGQIIDFNCYCPEGQWVNGAACQDCVICTGLDAGKYRKGCEGASAGICEDCEKCPNPSQLRAGCGFFSPGACKEKHELVRTPFCPARDGVSDETDNQLKIYVNQASGLGAFSFEQVFGVQKEQADFVCSSPCDGVEYNSIQCDGPFACNVKTCSESLQAEGNMIPIRACPVVIDEGDDSNTRLSKRRASCVKCSECGHVNKQTQSSYRNWGLGCVRECSKLQCAADELWDWTARKCSRCSELHSIDLCNTDDRMTLNLQSSRTVTGNWALLYFPDCEGNSASKKLESFTYGRCVSCDDNKNSCPGRELYPGACVDGHAQCRTCHRSGAQDFVRVLKDTWYNSLIPAWEPLHCQISACLTREGMDWTGVGQADRLCTTQCLPADCKAHETEVPCRLPHQARCEQVFPLQGPTARVQTTYFDGEVNLLNEDNGNKHTRFASFENTLIVLDSLSTQEFQCVWNAHGIFDNQGRPGGVSNVLWRAGRSDDAEYTLRGTQVCREWSVEAGEWMPVLPLQNTISTGDGDEDSSRRMLVNTEAYVLSYRFDGDFGDAVLQNINAGFTDQEHQPKATMLRGAHVGGAGRLFLMMILHEPKVLLAVKVPTDRAVHEAMWLQSLLLSFAVVDLTESSAVPTGLTVSVSVTADNKHVSDLDDNFVLESFWVQDIQA